MTFDPFQLAVDASQRQPHWWCRQCTYVMGMSSALWFVLLDEPMTLGRWFFALITVWCVIHSWRASASAEACARAATPRWWSITLWFMALVGVLAASTASSAASGMFGVTIAAFGSFASCRPPAPPKRKERLAFGGGGA